jgi:hypothetical protein
MTEKASLIATGSTAWRKRRQDAAKVIFMISATLMMATAHADDALPAPSNLEDAKSDILQLDRDLALLEQRTFLKQRTTLLFGLSPKSKQSVSVLRLTLDGQPLLTMNFAQQHMSSLKKGGMAPLWDQNLAVGMHSLEVEIVETTTNRTIKQRFDFKKGSERNLMALQLVERPAPNTSPIKLIEWKYYE